MQHTIQTDKIATLIYLWHFQAGSNERDGLSRQELDKVENLCNSALVTIDYPTVDEVTYDREGEPSVTWQEGFDWDDYILECDMAEYRVEEYPGERIMTDFKLGLIKTGDQLLALATKFA